MSRFTHVFIVLAVMCVSVKAQTTVILQNGESGYTGCEDSYLLRMQGILFAEKENIDVYYDSAMS